jgi:hypothetical protein
VKEQESEVKDLQEQIDEEKYMTKASLEDTLKTKKKTLSTTRAKFTSQKKKAHGLRR